MGALLTHPEVTLTNVTGLHEAAGWRARYDAALAQKGLAAHDVVIEASKGPASDRGPGGGLVTTNPRLVLRWPADLPGMAVLDLFEEAEAVVLGRDGMQLDPRAKERRDARAALVRVVLVRPPGTPYVSFDEGVQWHVDASLERDFHGALVDLDVAVYAARAKDRSVPTDGPPLQWLRLRGVPLVETPGHDEGEHWELGAELRFEPVTTTAGPPLLERAAEVKWEMMEPVSRTVTRLIHREELYAHTRKGTDAPQPANDRYLLAVHTRRGTADRTPYVEVSAEVALQRAQRVGGDEQTTRAWVVDGLEVVPRVDRKRPRGKRAVEGLLGDVALPDPADRGKRRTRYAVTGFEVRPRAGATPSVTGARLTRSVVDESAFWVLPEDFGRTWTAQVTSRPGAVVSPRGDVKLVRRVDVAIDDGWQTYVDDVVDVVRHVQLARAWQRRYAELHARWKDELDAFTRVASPIVAALGSVKLQTEGATVGGRRFVTLAQLHEDGPETASTREKLDRLRRIALRAEKHAQEALAAFTRPRFSRIFHTVDDWLAAGRTFDAPAFRDVLDADYRDAERLEVPAERLTYDAVFKLFLLSSVGGLFPLLGQGSVDARGQGRADPTLAARRKAFQEHVAPGLSEVLRRELQQQRGLKDAMKPAYFANTVFSSEQVWQSAAEGGWASLFYGRDGDRDLLAASILGLDDAEGAFDKLLQTKDDAAWDGVRKDFVRRERAGARGLQAFELVFNITKLYVDIRTLAAKGLEASVDFAVNLADAVVTSAELVVKTVKLVGGEVWFTSKKFLSAALEGLGKVALVIDAIAEIVNVIKIIWGYGKGKKLKVKDLVVSLVNLTLVIIAFAAPGVGQVLGFIFLGIQLVLSLFEDNPFEAVPDWLCRTPWGRAPIKTFSAAERLPWTDPRRMFRAAVDALNELFEEIYEDLPEDAQGQLRDFFLGYVKANAGFYKLRYTPHVEGELRVVVS